MVLPYFIIFTQIVRESYPFSNFPMYSNPTAEETQVIFVVDAENRDAEGNFIPISMEPVFGVRAARAKKILKSRLEDFGRKQTPQVKRSELSSEQVAKVARGLLEYLRERSQAIKTTDHLPARLALAQKTISPQLGVGFDLTETVIGIEP